MKPRRHPHETPRPMESASERWCAIFIGIGLVLLIVNGIGWVHDVSQYLQYNSFVGSTFIVGSSVQESYRISKAGPMNPSADLDRPPV